MKLILLLASILLVGVFDFKKSPGDFDNELTFIARKFVEVIMDKDECEKQKSAADDLADEIQRAIKQIDRYNSSELAVLKQLKNEAEAMEKFIGVVADCGNYFPSIDDFNLANRRVRANVVNIIKDKHCIDIITVSIGDYAAYLGLNNSTNNYTVIYKWKSLNGMTTGNGKMGLFKSSVRHIYDNRDNLDLKNISLFGISCTEI